MIQGEIWQINLNPTIGFEMKKVRPSIILNNNMVGKIALKIVAPLTDFKEYYRDVPWMVVIEFSSKNGLKKISSIDFFQVRSLSKKIGRVEEEILDACRESLEIVFE